MQNRGLFSPSQGKKETDLLNKTQVDVVARLKDDTFAIIFTETDEISASVMSRIIIRKTAEKPEGISIYAGISSYPFLNETDVEKRLIEGREDHTNATLTLSQDRGSGSASGYSETLGRKYRTEGSRQPPKGN